MMKKKIASAILITVAISLLFSGIATANPLPGTTDSGNFRMVNQ